MTDLSLRQEGETSAVSEGPKGDAPSSLTGLLVPLADRTLLLPNVAVAVTSAPTAMSIMKAKFQRVMYPPNLPR